MSDSLPPPEWPGRQPTTGGPVAPPAGAPPVAPPPPTAAPGQFLPPPSGDEPTENQSSGRGPLLILGGVALAVLVLIVVVAGNLLGGGDDPSFEAGGGTAADPGELDADPLDPNDPGNPGAGPIDPGQEGAPGLGGGGGDPLYYDPNLPNPIPDPTAAQMAQLRDLMALIDDAELAMIDWQTRAWDLFDTDLEGQAETSAQALRDLRAQMEALDLDGPPAAPIRDAYLPHLQAWIDYITGVGDDPTTLGSVFEDINVTAEEFVAAIPPEVGDMSTLPGDVEALIREIIERGFTGVGGVEDDPVF